MLLHRLRLLQSGRWDLQRAKGDVLLIKGRDELLAEGGEDDAAEHEDAESRADERPRPGHRAAEQRHVARLQPLDDAHFLFGDLSPHQKSDHRRDEGQGQDEGGAEGEHDGDRHRAPERGARQRNHRQDSGERGQHDRAGPPDGGFDDGFPTRQALGDVSLDLVDQNHRIAHDHAGQRDQPEQRHKAEGLVGDVQPERGADNTQRCREEHQNQAREALQLDHQQGQHDDDHQRKQDENRGVALGGFLERAARLDPVGRIEMVANFLQLRPDLAGHVGRLHAIDDVTAHGDRHVAVAPPDNRLLMGVFDSGDLLQRHRHPVARRHGEVADMAEVEPLRRHRARHHIDLLDAVAHRRHRRTRDQHAHRLRDVLRGEAKRAGSILIDHELQVRRLLVPVELRVLDVFVLLEDVTHLVGDVADGPGIRADHTKLDGKSDRRSEIEAIDADARFGQCPIIHRLLDARLDPLARLHILRNDHDLGERLVRELRIEPEPEARRALADIGRIGRDVLIVLQQRFRLLHRLFGDIERGAFGQPQLQEQFGPLGQREELLLDMAESQDREREDADGCQHHLDAMVDAPLNHAAQNAVDAGFIHRMGIVVVADRDVGQQLDADIGRKDHRHEPGRDQRDRHDPENAAGIFAHGRIGKADRQEAGRRDQRSRQHRKGGGFPGKGCRTHAVPALLHLHHHHLDRDDGVVDQQPERDDQGAERDPVQIERHRIHDDKDDCQHQRHRQGHHDAGAPAQRDERDEQHDRKRLDEGMHEFADRMFDNFRLVGDPVDIDALRHRLHEFSGRTGDILAELQNVGALGRDHADADGGLAFLAHHKARRIDESVGDGGDIA
ncbi:hypothetical protein GALL_434200 [mine drainage metagenome]|uniref:Uncharacterized protein n=1 Tax=mine drainage metagenome TaxID=410659 RepID=A0A1J5PVN5_9ZZZZ